MKGKITIVLFSLVLVFGMLAASCDNGAFPEQVDEDDSTYLAYKNVGNGLPVVDIDDDTPERIKSAKVYEQLQETEIKWSSDQKSYTIVNSYILGKVSTTPPKGQIGTGASGAYSDAELKIANKYLGMPIIIPNPARY